MEKNILFTIFVTFVLFIPMVSSEQYYADLVISVDESGNVDISGLTNHPALQGTFQNYTSKSGSTWTLNISPGGDFSDFLYEIILPEKAMISYIKAPGSIYIENSGSLVITGSGKNSELSLIVQYQIKPEKQDWLIPSIIILFSFSLVVFFLLRKKAENASESVKINKSALTDRERQIVSILEKNKDGITQSRLQKELALPKASLSRNVKSLVRKGVVVKSEKGMTNHISLKKS